MASKPGAAPAAVPAASRPFRVIDTGLRPGRAQIAFDQAMIDAHKAGEIPDSIRFLRFPPTALVGRHQALSREVRVDYCRANGIGIARRVTGGGAIYFDEGQLGWSLVFGRGTLAIASLGDLAREICEAAAAGLRRLGIDAQYRPRNDIEVGGRKISGTGGFFDGDTLFYQGTVLVDMDPAHMLAALNVPEAKLARRALDSASQRVVTLQELLGSAPDLAVIKAALLEGFTERLGIAPAPGDISAREEALASTRFEEEIGTEAFVASIDDPSASADVRSASHTGAGGTITAWVRLEGPRLARLREVLITGDFFVTPPRTVFDLESALRGVDASVVRAAVIRFFERAQVGLLSVAPGDFADAIEAAIAAGRR
ncbi:MAG: lipoate--protein ligase family protein [Betaproteobacteria bacterium]|nr:lipoate--protein ligase family protein [Betaproteobacteria bacterium]